MSTIEHMWDILDRRLRQRMQAPQTIRKLRKVIHEEWENISNAYRKQNDPIRDV